MIVYKLVKERLCPFILCDWCGKPIKPAEEGMVWRRVNLKEGETVAPMYLHYVECSVHVRQKMGGQQATNAERIDEFLGNLMYNSQIDYLQILVSPQQENRSKRN